MKASGESSAPRLAIHAFQMQIDINFSDIITPESVAIVSPATLGRPRRASRLRSRNVVAEKFEAMVKSGELNSRMKDFFDIWVLARTEPFRGPELSQAIEQTFSRRGTAPIADRFASQKRFAMNYAKIAQWAAFSSAE